MASFGQVQKDHVTTRNNFHIGNNIVLATSNMSSSLKRSVLITGYVTSIKPSLLLFLLIKMIRN